MFAVRRWTLPLLLVLACAAVATPASAQLTTPEQFLGFEPGADYRLATYEQAIGYYELLASQTGRMRVLDMGETPMGRRMKYAVVTSEENMARLDRHKEIARRLSLARGVSEEDARSLAAEGRTIVWVDGGLHASECAPAQQMIQLAYDLVSGEDRRTRSIRDNVIALLAFPNPDGMTLVAEWYLKNVGTEFETSPMPWLYNKYAGHDNNRDSLYANLLETRNLSRAQFHEWFLHIQLNHHQTAPFPARIFIPPVGEPTSPHVHPLVWRQQNLVGTAMGWAFDAAGQTGAISRSAFDSWYPGYVTTINDVHNTPSILTEIALHRYATPRQYTLDDFPEAYKDLTAGHFYPSPWKPGWWRIGDAVAYALTASKAVLETGAKFREEFLYDKYRMARDSIDQGLSEPPFGWIIAPAQHDPGASSRFIEKLLLLGAEVHRAEEAFEDGGKAHPPGTYFVPASQPFAALVKSIFLKQDYPDLRKYPHLWRTQSSAAKDEPPLRPYDVSGWTLPLQFGLATSEMSRPLEVRSTLVSEIPVPAGSVSGKGPLAAFDRSDLRSFTAAARVLAAKGRLATALDEFEMGGRRFSKGAFLVATDSLPAARLNEIAAQTGAAMVAGTTNVQTEPVRALRVGLYRPWQASMDEGWMRLVFDEWGIPYATIADADVRAGSLRERFDVIVLPDQSPSSIVDGHKPGTVPPEYTGGITKAGVENLKAFVQSGGVLVANGGSCGLAIETFALPVENVARSLPSSEFFIPGSILKVDYEAGHPVAFGMPARGVAFFSRSTQVFRVKANASGSTPITSVAAYPREPLLLSGFSHGDASIQGGTAIVEARAGSGTIVLFGFNVVNRYQTPANLRLLFNAVYRQAPTVSTSAQPASR